MPCFFFSVQGSREEVIAYFKNFTGIAHAYGMKVCGDCNTDLFAKLGASEKDLFVIKEMGIGIVRMDVCYMDDRDVTLINNTYGIGVEMSAGFLQPIDQAIAHGADVRNLAVCHNFYPQKYTGVDIESTKKINDHWKEKRVRSSIFYYFEKS